MGKSLAGQGVDADGLGPFLTQTLNLKAGWNAVYIYLEPQVGDPDDLFSGTPISIVATYFRPSTSMQFIDNPNAILDDRNAWSVWYAPDRDDTLLTDLYSIQSHRAYLVYSESVYTWQLQGTPFFGRTEWHANSFNLVGFHTNPADIPTVASYFNNASAHLPLQIYTMNSGKWVRVINPESTQMSPGAAYWAHSKGASNFSGPLRVDFPTSAAGGIPFTVDQDTTNLTVKNVSEFPLELTVTLEAGNTGLIPLAYLVRALNTTDAPMETLSIGFPQSLSIGPLEPGQSFALSLQVVQSEVTVPAMSTTLRIATDSGQLVDVPLILYREDLDTE